MNTATLTKAASPARAKAAGRNDPASLPPRYEVSRARKVTDAAATVGVMVLSLIAIIPLVSLLWMTISRGLARLDLEFFTYSMRGIIGDGGGAVHAIVGTLFITAATVVICVPIGIGTAIYLVEYSTGVFPRIIRFVTDVMTGIPSIVAGLFVYALVSLIVGPGSRSGIAGAIALSILMLPVVIRSTEEMLLLVPDDLREASTALGAAPQATIGSVVLPTARSGIIAGVMLGVCRVIGETAPLLLVVGFTDSMNTSLIDGRMSTLPVYIYSQWSNKGANQEAYDNRAWTAALVLIVLVLIFNLGARAVTRLLRKR